MQNALIYLTTERQRKLIRMKADKQVIILDESDKELLNKPLSKLNLQEITKMHDDSTVFESEEYERYVEDLQTKTKNKEISLENKERELLESILTIHMRDLKCRKVNLMKQVEQESLATAIQNIFAADKKKMETSELSNEIDS